MDSGFKGDAVLEWQEANPQNRRLYVPKTAPGFVTSQPATIYLRMTTPPVPGVFPDGLNINFAFARSSADDRGSSDTAHPNTYAYHKPSGGEDINAGIPVGTAYKIEVFSDTNLTTSLAFHAANRWERDDRNEVQVNQVAVAGNTDRWAKTKLPTDVAYTADLPTPSAQGAGFVALTTVYPSANLTAGTGTNTFPSAEVEFSVASTSAAVNLNDHDAGEIHFSIELEFAEGGGSFPNMGFATKVNQTAEDRRLLLTELLFITELKTRDDLTVNGVTVTNGTTIARVPVYDNITVQGYYNLVVGSDLRTDGRRFLEYYWFWEGTAGVSTPTITVTLRSSISPTDQHAPVGVPWTEIANEQYQWPAPRDQPRNPLATLYREFGAVLETGQITPKQIIPRVNINPYTEYKLEVFLTGVRAVLSFEFRTAFFETMPLVNIQSTVQYQSTSHIVQRYLNPAPSVFTVQNTFQVPRLNSDVVLAYNLQQFFLDLYIVKGRAVTLNNVSGNTLGYAIRTYGTGENGIFRVGAVTRLFAR